MWGYLCSLLQAKLDLSPAMLILTFAECVARSGRINNSFEKLCNMQKQVTTYGQLELLSYRG